MQSVSPPKKIPPDRNLIHSPCVSIIMPFEPKMIPKSRLEAQLKEHIEETQTRLLQHCSSLTAQRMLRQVRETVSGLDYSSHCRSIAIFVSSEYRKILYLHFDVQDRLIISNGCDIHELIITKKPDKKYLLLILSNQKARLYLGHDHHLMPMITNMGDHIPTDENFVPERVSNFSDPKHRKELLVKKFIRHVDEGVSIILQSYPLPLFLACPKKTKGYFNQVTKNKNKIVEYIHGNFEDKTEAELIESLAPFLQDWDRVTDKELLMQLERAKNERKCAAGIQQVYKMAMQKRGQLLLIERNFLELENGQSKQASGLLKNTLNAVIEKVLENGGNVEIISGVALKEYNHIALIQFY